MNGFATVDEALAHLQVCCSEAQRAEARGEGENVVLWNLAAQIAADAAKALATKKDSYKKVA